MASSKQIQANRRNAQKSTGPRTKLGRQLSSRNAWRHGLSLPAPDEAESAELVTGLAALFSISRDNPHFEDFSRGYLEVARTRRERARAVLLLLNSITSDAAVGDPRALLRMERYERLGTQKRRRGLRNLKNMLR